MVKRETDETRSHRCEPRRFQADIRSRLHVGSRIGSRVGSYRIVSELGAGGMGTVYKAEQTERIQRTVALKIIEAGDDPTAVLARFEQERQALAVMNHDGIARVHDAGTTDDGHPFFAMELVRGVPLGEYCRKYRVALSERIELVREVCAAVTHAHQKGVLHRDLKPGNVLVTEEAGKRRIKVIDFGLAKAMGPRLQQTGGTDRGDAIVGTKEYMAPEQANPSNAGVDTRVDVYSIGVMLYELLIDERPFSVRGMPVAEFQRVLRETDPPRPSTRFGTTSDHALAVAEARQVKVGVLRKALQTDLDWLLLKALAKDPAQRYHTTEALSEDLRRFLVDEPLRAVPDHGFYRAKKLLRRNRKPAAAALLMAMGFALSAVLALIENARARQKSYELDQLANVVRYTKLIERQRTLPPPWPENLGTLQAWLEECDGLLESRNRVRRTVEDLRRSSPTSDSTSTFLLAGLEGLSEHLDRLDAWGRPVVARQVVWAEQVRELTFAHRSSVPTWEEAREAVRQSEHYRDQQIDLSSDNVLGLVPIGCNPETGLWEFYDLRSAWDGESDPHDLQIPRHNEDGSIDVADGTGVVFVLIPGGKGTVGAQSVDPNAPNYYQYAGPDEKPGKAELDAFLLARHELTQGQWARLWIGARSERQPSKYLGGTSIGDARITWANPVERVDWYMSRHLLEQHGMTLPTEAQWEYACRAGSQAPWHCAPNEFAAFANVADAGARATTLWRCETWEDGHVVHAPVGSFAANAFGLHDMHGNVYELCLDEYGDHQVLRKGDGLRLRTDGSTARISRGGSFAAPAYHARSAFRGRNAADYRYHSIGLRAARSLAKRPDR